MGSVVILLLAYFWWVNCFISALDEKVYISLVDCYFDPFVVCQFYDWGVLCFYESECFESMISVCYNKAAFIVKPSGKCLEESHIYMAGNKSHFFVINVCVRTLYEFELDELLLFECWHKL